MLILSISVILNLRLLETILHLSKNEKLSNERIDEITKLKETLSDLVKERNFSNKKELELYKNMDNFPSKLKSSDVK